MKFPVSSFQFPVFVSLFLLIGGVAFAHKVNIFAYVEADTVYTESYFPDGKKVKEAKIIVYDSQGNKLLEGKTDKEGKFSFKVPKYDNLKIVVEASLGHKNFYLLSKKEILSPQEESSSGEYRREFNQRNNPQEVRKREDSLREEIASLKELILKAQEKESLREVIAGVGYIFGIMGIIFYFLAKREKNASARN